jgi:ADP-heptose:LPS heptosyltransferase
VKRILVFGFIGMGDYLVFSPCLRGIREAFPQARIVALAKPDTYEVAQRSRCVDRTIVFDRNAMRGRNLLNLSSWRAGLALLRDLRRERFDAAVILDHKNFALGVAGMVCASARIPIRVGCYMSAWARRFLTVSLPAFDYVRTHELDRYAALTKLLGFEFRPERPVFPVTQAERTWAERYLQSKGVSPGNAVVALHPGSDFAPKNWPLSRFAYVGDDIAARFDARVLLTGGAREISLAQEVASKMASPSIVSAGQTTLGQFAALLERARVLVAGDSGAVRLAAAVGTRTVSIFGPAAVARFGPLGPGHRVLQAPVAFGEQYVLGPYPRWLDWGCVLRVDAKQVAQAVAEVLCEANVRDEPCEHDTPLH